MHREPIQSYEEFMAEKQRKAVAQSIERERQVRSLSTVDSEITGFAEFCMVSIFIIGGLLAGAFIMGLI